MSNETDYTLLFWAAGSFAVGGLFYYAYSNGYYFAETLENVPQYEVGERLVSDTAKKSDCSIPYAAVTGYAKADDSHVTSLYDNGTKGLIAHNYVVEHYRKQDHKSDTWNKDKGIISNHWSFKPFSLSSREYSPVHQSRVRLSVRKPLVADGLKLSTVYNHYEVKSGNAAEKIVDYLTGYHAIGVQTIEKMLLPGTKLTAVGKVILHDGQIRVEPPENGLRYFLTQDSIDSLVKAEEYSYFAKRLISYVFFSTAGVICAVWLYDFYKKYKRELEYRRLEQENSDDNDACSICLSGEKNIVLIPCGHVCVCKNCAKEVKKCPVCRKIIDRKIPIYRS